MLEFNKEHLGADLTQIKSKVSKAKNASKVMVAGVLISSVLLLSGCNYDWLDLKYSYPTAIVFSEDHATIFDIEKWRDYDGEQIQISTKEGVVFLTSSFDTKLYDEEQTGISAEDFIKALKGDDYTINYFSDYADKKHY